MVSSELSVVSGFSGILIIHYYLNRPKIHLLLTTDNSLLAISNQLIRRYWQLPYTLSCSMVYCIGYCCGKTDQGNFSHTFCPDWVDIWIRFINKESFCMRNICMHWHVVIRQVIIDISP